jgi:hypothetical protein
MLLLLIKCIKVNKTCFNKQKLTYSLTLTDANL